MTERCEPAEGTEELTLHLLRAKGATEPLIGRWLGGVNREWAVGSVGGLVTVFRAERFELAGWECIRPIPTPSELAAAKAREAALVSALKRIAGRSDSPAALVAIVALEKHAPNWRTIP